MTPAQQTGPVVAVLDPAYPFSLAAVHACATRDEAADLAVRMRREWPNGMVQVLYPAEGEGGRAVRPSPEKQREYAARHRAKFGTERDKRQNAAYRAALQELRERHRAEFEAIYAEKRRQFMLDAAL